MIAAIIQARMGSTRLPGKIMMKVNGKTLLELMIMRVKMSQRLDKIIIAIPDTPENEVLEDICRKEHVEVFKGDEEDVLSRYYHAAYHFKVDTIVRLTSDCPLMDPKLVDHALSLYNGEDYFTNIISRTYPDGEDIEIISFSALKAAFKEASEKHDREHVTTFIGSHPERFNCGNFKYVADISRKRWTLDYQEDYDFIKAIFEEFDDLNFTMEDILELLTKKTELGLLNATIAGKDNLKIAIDKLKVKE